MKKFFIISALFAGLALAPALVRAEPDVSAASGDLILGFQLSGSNDLEVDIGSLNTYLDATSVTPVTFGVVPADQLNAGATVTSLSADLATNFGTGWASNGLLYWGLAGAQGNTGFLSVDSLNPIPGRPSTSGANLTEADINSLVSNLSSDPSTTNSTEAASVLTTAAGSWDSFTPLNGAFDTSLNIEQLPGTDTATDSTLTLWELAPNGRNGGGNGTDIGTFTLNGSGDLTFTPAAVPEPSTWASLFGGGLLLMFLGSRRKSRVS
jgi:hypothetical protein